MVGSRKLNVLAMGAAAVCMWTLTACGGGADSPGADPVRTRSTSRRPGGLESQAASPAIDLAGLLSEVPEYQGIGRNLFAFGQERAAVEAPPPVSTLTATTTAPQAPPNSNQRRTPARIDLKFAGFVEKTDPGGANKKYAVLLDGEEILTGAEGDVVGNRYKIVEIGLESVTVALEGSPFTQKIPLRTN